MSAARCYIDDQTLKSLQLEMVALKIVIENDQAAKLKALLTANDDAATLQQIRFKKQNIELEYQTRIQFLNRCNTAAEYIVATQKRRSNSRLFRQFQLTEDFIARDMDLLITTIRLTNKLISKPDESAETFALLTQNTENVNLHLKSEQKATKKKNIWLGITASLMALLSLVCAASIYASLLLMPPLGFGATLAICGLVAVLIMGGTLGAPMAFVASNLPRQPAGSVAALSKTAESFYKPMKP